MTAIADWPDRTTTGMQLVASMTLVVIGLALALVVDTPGDMRFFGWVLVVVGVFGLVVRWVIARLREQDQSNQR